MPGTTTPNGYPYPESTDRVTDGADAIQALAEKIQTQLGAMHSGRVLVSIAAASLGTSTVTMPVGRFSETPNVAAGAENTQYFAGITGSSTKTAITLYVRQQSGTSATTSMYVNFVARQPL